MAISFCRKCKNILPPKNSKEDLIVVCPNCGEYQLIKEKLITKEKRKPETKKGKGVGEGNPFATYEHVCKKCGFNKAQVICIPAKYSDEDDLVFLKCGHCGFSERIGEVY